jgi:LmbE family N-acetylglucosaminyl deacetylase
MTTLQPLVIFSPHLDDAVLSCGALMAKNPGSVVATVFAGTPRDSDEPGDWDVQCEFGSATEAMDTRKREDRNALALLSAELDHGPVLDEQYRIPTNRSQQIRNYVRRVLDECQPSSVFIPLGLGNPVGDHAEVRNQALAVYRQTRSTEPWFVYIDLPYGRKLPEQIRSAESVLRDQGIHLGQSTLSDRVGEQRKLGAVDCYETQVRVLFRGYFTVAHLVPEEYKQLELSAA